MPSSEITKPTHEEQNPLNKNYSRWGEGSDWRQKLRAKAAHKSIDIPYDDDVIGSGNEKNETNYNGIGGWPIVAALATAAGTFLGYEWLNREPTPATPEPKVVEREIDYDVDADMTVIPPEKQ